MNIVLLGAPGSGKGTAAKRLREDLKIAHVSTGDIFRENLKNETELGKQAKVYMDKGELVPDEITVNMLAERLKSDDTKNGVIFDGFPRTINQAESLDKMLEEKGLKVDIALDFEVPFEEIIGRMANRRTCKECGIPYSLTFNPPKAEGKCDECGGTLIQREDEKPEVVEKRLAIYKEQSEPLIEYYGKQDKLYKAQAGDAVGKNTHQVVDEFEEFLNG